MAITPHSDSGKELWRALERTFGLPPNVTSFDLHMAADEVVTVTITYAPEAEIGIFDTVTRRFYLADAPQDEIGPERRQYSREEQREAKIYAGLMVGKAIAAQKRASNQCPA